MPRRARVNAVLAPFALLAVLASVAAADANRSPICTRGITTVTADPRGLLPLTGVNPIGPATAAALRYTRRGEEPQVVSATLAIDDSGRGAEAKVACGRRVWQRTVVVYVTRRALLPSESASQGVFFVGRFKTGYRVWQVVH
jgi:hypothetical protein